MPLDRSPYPMTFSLLWTSGARSESGIVSSTSSVLTVWSSLLKSLSGSVKEMPTFTPLAPARRTFPRNLRRILIPSGRGSTFTS